MLEPSPLAASIASGPLREPPEAREAPVGAGWIIGPRADLLWLVGAPLWGLLLWIGFAQGQLALAPAWLAWIALTNGPHFFATYTRTYLVRDEWRVRGGLLAASLGLFLLGPLLLWAEGAMGSAAADRSPLPWYFAAVNVWGYWHVVRQHHGLLRLYQRHDADLSAFDARLEAALLHITLLVPFVWLLSVHPDVREGLSLSPVEADPPSVRALRAGLGLTAVAAAGLFVLRQVHRRLRGERLQAPRLLFFGAVAAYHAWVCLSPRMLLWPLFIVAPLLVLPHDLQYHAIVWFYQRNQRRRALEQGGRPALGVRIALSLPLYAALSIGLGLLLAASGCSVDRALGCPAGFYDSTPGWLGLTPRGLLFVFFHAFAVHHYFIDQFIWRPSREVRVAQGLGVGLT
jgi:hypothetical protein